MRSGNKGQRRVFAVAVVAGACGAFLGLDPALGAQGAHPKVSAITAYDSFAGVLGDLGENEDGTAFVAVFVPLGPTTFVGTLSPAHTDYAISTDFNPGQSGQGGGSGDGQFTIEGVFAFDWTTGASMGPYDVRVEIAVTDATTVEAFISQGVTTQFDPFTGESSVVREHIIGNQAYGDTAGSLRISVDDGSGPVDAYVGTGCFGTVRVDTVHQVVTLH